MTTSPNKLTPLRDQPDIVDRWTRRATAAADDEQRGLPPQCGEWRQKALANIIDRAHAEPLIPAEQRDELLDGYPEQAPSRQGVIHGLVTGQQTNRFIPPTTLETLIRRIRGLRIELDMLAEYTWALGHDQASEAMVDPREHHEAGHVALMSIVRFCQTVGVTLPTEGEDGTLAPDLQDAVDALAAEAEAARDAET